MYGCQQVLIHAHKDIQAILEYLCSESNKIYNCATYYARQIWFKTKRIVNRAEICASMVSNPHFGAMYVSSSQQTCNAVAEAFKSFKELTKTFNKGETEQKPKPPRYRKIGGLYTVSFPIKWLKPSDRGIRIPLGKKVKAWFGIEAMFKDCKTGGYNLEGSKANPDRLVRLILLIALAMTSAWLQGQRTKLQKQQPYVCRTQEKGRTRFRHSNFWIGLYGQNWITAFHECQIWVEELIGSICNKQTFYRRGLKAMSLIQQAL